MSTPGLRLGELTVTLRSVTLTYCAFSGAKHCEPGVSGQQIRRLYMARFDEIKAKELSLL